MNAIANHELAGMVHPDRVHRRVYSDQAVFDLEMDRIFGRGWIYVGHESMAKKPNDFFSTWLGREPIIITRDEEGRLHGLINRCPHRGAQVCSSPKGHAKHLTCPYHAWTFRMDGSLEAMPRMNGYDASFDRDAHGLPRIPRVASYRGFIFASLAPKGPGLTEHLGSMAEALDNMVDRSPTGELEAVGGVFHQEYAGNWKLHMENATDLVHPGVVHESSVVAGRATAAGRPGEAETQALQMLQANGLTIADFDRVNLKGSPQGHCYMGAFYSKGDIAPERTDPDFLTYRAALVARMGEEKTRKVLGRATFNNLIYPNISVNPLFQTMRRVQPLGPDRSIVHSSCFRMVGAPEDFFHKTITFLSTANSPSSLISTDDIAIFERTQAGLVSQQSEWINLARNIHMDETAADGTMTAKGTSEMAIRLQFKAWLHHMVGEAA